MKASINRFCSVASTIERTVEQRITQKSQQKGTKEGLTNALDAMARRNMADVKPSCVVRKIDLLKRPDIKSGVREFILNCEEGSDELKAVDTIMDIAKQREAGFKKKGRILDGFEKDSKIPQNLIKDLNNKELPVFKTKEEALKEMKTGDVFFVEGDKFVSIVKRDGKTEHLKMSPENYNYLFPSVDRYSSVQSEFGNCYEVTALNALMDNPKTRENILMCIDTESSPGMIKVSIPNSVLGKPVEMKLVPEGESYMRGAKGFSVIEYALGKEYERELINLKKKEFIRQGRDSASATLEGLYACGEDRKLVNFLNAPDKTKSLGVNLRDGGVALVPWSKLGLRENKTIVNGEKEAEKIVRKPKNSDKNVSEEFNDFLAEHYVKNEPVYSREEFAECMWSPEFFENNIVEASFLKDDILLGLKADHSYYLKPVLDKNGKIESYLIKDPHGIVEKPISFEDALEKIDVISFAKID